MKISYDIGIIIVIILLTYMMCSCASTKSTITEQSYQESHDTITLTITDTVTIENTVYVDRATSTTENRNLEVIEKKFREDGTISSETTTRDKSYIVQRDSLVSRISYLEERIHTMQQSSSMNSISYAESTITKDKKRSKWFMFLCFGVIVGAASVLIYNNRASILKAITKMV